MYSIQLRQKVPAGETISLKRKFHSAGILETISFRFYPGQMLDLTIMARVNRLGGSYIDVYNYADGSEILIAGDDDYFKENIGIPISRGEYLELIVKNNSVVPESGLESDYAYDFNVYAFVNEVVG